MIFWNLSLSLSLATIDSLGNTHLHLETLALRMLIEIIVLKWG